MPLALETPLSFVAPPHKRWTRDECASLAEVGLIQPNHYELIEGELLLKVPKSYPYMFAVMLIGNLLRKMFGDTFVLQKGSIDLVAYDSESSEPEPDLVVLGRPFPQFKSKPSASDTRLAVEVSLSTLSFDLTIKSKLYARSSIPEYWVVDVEGRRLIVHRDPVGDSYRQVAAYGASESLAPLAAPRSQLRVIDLF